MTTSHELAADEIADRGSKLGAGLWLLTAGLGLNDRRDAFETALQVIAQYVPGREQANLTEAYAMLALVDQFPKRALTIEREAEDAYWECVALLRAEALADEADYRADMAKEVA